MDSNTAPSRRDAFDEELPFDELDPCCQKEVLNERRKREVNQKLRGVDRSNQRIDIKKSVFTFYGMSSCQCCSLPQPDYSALRGFKAEMCAVDESKAREEERQRKEDEKFRAEVGEEEEEESDDDPLLDDFDLPLTAEEQERMRQLAQYTTNLETAKKYGLGIHLEESIEHLLEFIENPTVPLILHIYQATSQQSAVIDYLLEKTFSERYLGTRFRRHPYSYHLATDERLHEWQKYFTSTSDALLLCFKGKQIIAYESQPSKFGDHIDDINSNLRRFLENSKALETEVPHVSVLFPNNSSALKGLLDNDDEEEIDERKFCDDPDCVRKYPHEHVGRKTANNATGASFISSKNRVGEEALAPDLLRKL